MEVKLYKVIRLCDGIMEERYKGTYKQCQKWIARRGDTGRAYYQITDPETVDVNREAKRLGKEILGFIRENQKKDAKVGEIRKVIRQQRHIISDKNTTAEEQREARKALKDLKHQLFARFREIAQETVLKL